MSGCGESKEDGQKVAASSTGVRNCCSRVKQIEAGTIWPRKEEDGGDEGDKDKEEEQGRRRGSG